MPCGDPDLDQRCRFSDTPTFTRHVDILPEGDRLVNGMLDVERVIKAR
jgi:hypothetical protein